MAQFGKHLFGTSYFGKTSTFDGEYETEMVDADEPFTGAIRAEIEANLPVMSYKANNNQLAYKTKSSWKFIGTTATASKTGEEVSILACGSDFTFQVKKIDGGGTADVLIKEIQTGNTQTHKIDTATQDKLSLNLAYADYLVTIKTTSDNPFTLKSIDIRVANIGIEVRTATKLNGDIPVWEEYIKIPLAYDNDKKMYIGESPTVTNQRYVQLKLHLATSESDAAPVVDAIHFSSGDLSKHAENGYWQAAINFNKVAKDNEVTFKRVKRLEWTEKEEENSILTFKSTSVSATNQSPLPSRQEILNASYWKPETAQYKLVHNGKTKGTPTSRISLAEKENGFSESSVLASVMIGPINTKKANLTNTKLVRWLKWDDEAFYPTNRQSVSIVYELFKNKNDIDEGYPPIFRVTDPSSVIDRILTLAPEDQTESVYLRIQLKRISGRQSPVVDYVDLIAQMHYESSSAIGSYQDKLSALDGIDVYGENGKGKKELRTVNHTIYDWPSLSQSLPVNTRSLLDNKRKVDIRFTPKYHNQVNIGIGDELEKEKVFNADEVVSFKLFSKTIANEPSASTKEVPSGKLSWHYSYDGGTVNFPLKTERDLSTDFTPSLLQNKKYRFYIQNGWKDQTFQVPFSMTWEEVSDMIGYQKEDLITTNKNIKLYNNQIPMGYTIKLPNDSLNNKIRLVFKETGNKLSERSLWNGSTNDRIEASIPAGGDYRYTEWVSDEVIYDGMINANDLFSPYVRTQFASQNARKQSLYTVTKAEETAKEIAKQHAVNEEDILLSNNNKKSFKSGDKVLIPGGFVLPDIAPGLIYEGDNPYVVEVIPGSVHKTNDDILLPEDTLIPGSDDEPAIQYTLTESPSMEVILKRGSVRNGQDVIPLSNVMKVTAVKNNKTGVSYVPYSKVGTSEMGDYILKNNTIDWSPSQSGGKEPAVGEEYTVTLTHGIVNTLRIIYTSNYNEKMAQDRLWRSKETVEIEGTVGPEKDVYLNLPSPNAFGDYKNDYKQIDYVVEDNDLWVETSIKEIDGVKKLKASLNGEDPKRNWYPTIQTGFYYLDNQEYYLYSEPTVTTFAEKEVPIIKDVKYTEEGLVLQ